MKLSTYIIPLLAFALVFSANLALPVQADAACSYNGYINSGGKCSKSFKNKDKESRKEYRKDFRSYRITSSNDFRDQSLLRLIELLKEQILRLESQIGNGSGNNSDVSVSSRSATDIERNSATLRGVVDLENEDEAEVYFKYGTNRANLNKETDHKTIDEDDATFNFSRKIDNLERGVTYYFRAIAEDEDGDKDLGTILSFKTDDNATNDDEPDLVTQASDEIKKNSARLRGTVDMNDFNNGRVFFVYGEAQSQVDDIAGDYDQYSDIDEDGDDLQKVLVDDDLDNSDTYRRVVSGLDSDTRIYYSICVEYEDEDNDDTITCGDTESFRTSD